MAKKTAPMPKIPQGIPEEIEVYRNADGRWFCAHAESKGQENRPIPLGGGEVAVLCHKCEYEYEVHNVGVVKSGTGMADETTHAEYLGDIDIHDILNKLENFNPNVNSSRTLPKGKYHVMVHRHPGTGLVVRLELEPEQLRN